MKCIAAALGWITLVASLSFAAEPLIAPKQLKPADLAGTYEIVSGEKDGEAIPAERIKGSRVAFTVKSITATDKNDKQTYAAEYQLDFSGKTPAILMVSSLGSEKGMKAAGLISKVGDAVQLIYHLPGGTPPTEFKTREGQQMFVLKAVPAKAAP